MVDTLDSTGLHLDDTLTRLDSLHGELRTAISSVLDLSADSPWGEISGIDNEHHQRFAELLQLAYNGMDPDQATGQTQDANYSMVGVYRRAATKGTVDLTLTFTAAGTASAGSIVAVNGDPTNQWILDADVVATGAGTESGSATAAIAGVYNAPAGTITTIVTPAANWSAVTNSAAASPGLDRETDTEFRLRREQELAQGGSTTVDAVQAEVSQITGVLEVIVLGNSSWHAVAPMPPKSIETIYWSTYTGAALTALNVEIAEAVFTKAGGIQAYGTTTVNHTDSQGNVHPIGMTLATEKTLELRYTLETDSDYPGDAAFSAQVASEVTTLLGIGDDVDFYRMIDIGFNVTGVTKITALSMQLDADGWSTADRTVGQREIATLDAGDVTVI